jgi:hypothetical protein
MVTAVADTLFTETSVPAGTSALAGTDHEAGRVPSREAGETRPVLEIHVFGQPAPQGSKSAFRNQHTGRIQQVESSKKVKPWREAVKHAALDVIGTHEGTGDPFAILGEPLFVYSVYSFVRPTTHYRTGRNAHMLRDQAPAFPISKNKNDLEKLDRSTRDALTDAGVWTDDSLVVHHDSWKVFAREHVDALPVAGAVIRIYRMGDLAT